MTRLTLNAGDLRHRVTVQARETTRDAYGAPSTAWVDHATVWAKVSPLSAREFIAASGVSSQVTTRVTIRYREDIDATMRLSYRGKLLNIEGVLPDPQSGREWLTLACSEGTDDA